VAAEGVLVQAGKLDRRIVFQKATESQSASGAVVETWSNVATVWATYLPESGTEGFRETQEQGWSVVRFRTRYWVDVDGVPTVKYRIVFDDVVYDILEVRELGRREGWEFVARARAEDAR
jgi:SPP1 family predicted phage head-tail adaptor